MWTECLLKCHGQRVQEWKRHDWNPPDAVQPWSPSCHHKWAGGYHHWYILQAFTLCFFPPLPLPPHCFFPFPSPSIIFPFPSMLSPLSPLHVSFAMTFSSPSSSSSLSRAHLTPTPSHRRQRSLSHEDTYEIKKISRYHHCHHHHLLHALVLLMLYRLNKIACLELPATYWAMPEWANVKFVV